MQPRYDHSNTSESWESIHNDEKQLHNWADAISLMQIGAFLKKVKHGSGYGWMRRDVKIKNKASNHWDTPAVCIWPDRGERQLCVWCHSSESHQSRTGPNTSESRTHNCFPLKKHRWDFKNRISLSSERRENSESWMPTCLRLWIIQLDKETLLLGLTSQKLYWVNMCSWRYILLYQTRLFTTDSC